MNTDDTNDAGAPGEGERIAKVLSRAGVASRRDVERLILEGRVTKNGELVTSPATNATPRDRLAVDGEPVGLPEDTRLWLYHKPAGLVTSEADEEGRPTVFDSLPDDMPRVMSVGRLDMTSEGLLLLTNDGEVKRRLELPSTGWSRRYRVRIHGTPQDADFDALRKGAHIDGMDYQPMEVRIDRQQGSNAWLTVTIHEGKNREIRRAMEHLGFTVNRLIRISFGPFQLGDLPVGDVEEVKPRIVRDQLGLTKKPEVARARKPKADDAGLPVAEPEDRPERDVLATPRPEGARVKRELKPRGPKVRGTEDEAPRARKPRAPREGVDAKSAFQKPRTYMRVDEDRARAAAEAERGEEDRPRRPRSEGFRSQRDERGTDRPRAEGFRSHRSEAGDRPARDGDRPYKPRTPRDGDAERKPRWSADRRDGDSRPARDAGDRPQRGFRSDRPADGDRPARPYKPRTPREDGDRPARAYKPRAQGDEARPARPYKPRTPRDGDDRPYKPREGGDRPARSFGPRAEGDRPARGFGGPRAEGDRPARPYKPREGGDRPAGGFRKGPPRAGAKPGRPSGPKPRRG